MDPRICLAFTDIAARCFSDFSIKFCPGLRLTMQQLMSGDLCQRFTNRLFICPALSFVPSVISGVCSALIDHRTCRNAQINLVALPCNLRDSFAKLANVDALLAQAGDLFALASARTF